MQDLKLNFELFLYICLILPAVSLACRIYLILREKELGTRFTTEALGSYLTSALDSITAWHFATRISADDLGPRKIASIAYRRLKRDQFRLLILAHGKRDQELCFRLVHCNTRDSYRYEALSYAWGDSIPVVSCSQDGVRRMIPLNLSEALFALRLTSRPRILWADALCIDQDDELEKKEQVQMMPHIYHRAVRVIVWLGKWSPATQMAFSWKEFRLPPEQRTILGYVFAPPKQTAYFGFDFGASFKRISRRATLSEVRHSLMSAIDWPMLDEFLSLPWFRRAWVLQEIIYGRQVVIRCGEFCLSWQDLTKKVLAMNRDGRSLEVLSKTAQQSVKNIVAMISTTHANLRQQKLLPTLLRTNSTECADPRDKIYAVLSLAGEARDFSIFQPDYSLSIMDAYELCAGLMIETTGQLQVLCCTTSSTKASIKAVTPSWVPDWTRLENDDLFAMASTVPFRTSGPVSPQTPRLQNRVLTFQGVRLDILKAVHGPADFTKTSVYSEQDVNAFARSSRWIVTCMQQGWKSTQAHELWRVMLCDLTGKGTRVDSDYKLHFRRYLKFRRRVGKVHRKYAVHDPGKRRKAFQALVSKCRDDIAAVESSLCRWSSRRQFAATNKSRLAFVPGEARAGDVVCAVSGLSVPIILRSNGKAGYTSIGEAYVHGVMYGEDADVSPRPLPISFDVH